MEGIMAKERLSKLQKWILSESYKLNILHDGSVVGRESCGYFLRGPDYKVWSEFAYQYFECWIYEKYYGFRHWHGDGFSQMPEYNKAHVTVHRSVKNLEKKGLITVKYAISNARNWRITEKGIAALNL
jgi:hypothetical protein